MADLEAQLNRWQSAGVIDAAIAERIRAHEAMERRPAGAQWQVVVALTFGAILLVAGVGLFVSAHWDQISPPGRYLLVMAMVCAFHVGGALARSRFAVLATTLHAIGTFSIGPAIALVGQIFNIQEHWPAAVMLWAFAAGLGWLLLRDQAQQTMAVLLLPAWLLCEWSDASRYFQGADVYSGRFLAVWAVLYLAFFLDERRKLVWGFTYTVAAVSLVAGTLFMLEGWDLVGWRSEGFLTPHLRILGWLLIAVLPLLIALVRLGRALVPTLVILTVVLILPLCRTIKTQPYARASNYSTPNIFAHILVSATAIFLGWWGLRQNSKTMVNYGIIAFAISVGWFYFTDLFDKLGRSLGLIGLGVLFLAGGWALERTRRRLMAQISTARSMPMITEAR